MQGCCPSDHDYGKIVQQFQKAEEIQEKRRLRMSCAINNIVCISSGSFVVFTHCGQTWKVCNEKMDTYRVSHFHFWLFKILSIRNMCFWSHVCKANMCLGGVHLLEFCSCLFTILEKKCTSLKFILALSTWDQKCTFQSSKLLKSQKWHYSQLFV